MIPTGTAPTAPSTGPSPSALVRAVRPTLFGAAEDPDLIFALLLSNLMSPSLRPLAGKALPKAPADPAATMRKIRKFVDNRFSHIPPLEMARIWGLHERERIADPEERAAGDGAMEMLRAGYLKTRETDRPMREELWDFLKMEAFPEFLYPTLDLIPFREPVPFPERTGGTLGLTSCFDECLLLATLAVSSGHCAPEDLIFLGSPFHYTLFAFAGDRGFWFNGKRELLPAEEWESLHPGDPLGAARELDSRVLVYDRIVTARGSRVRGRSGGLAGEDLRRAKERISGFLGFELNLFDGGKTDVEESPDPGEGRIGPDDSQNPDSEKGEAVGLEGEQPSSGAAPWRQEVREPEAWEAEIRRRAGEGEMPSRSALHAFRSLRGTEPGAFAEAALRGYRVYLQSAAIANPDEGIRRVRALGGTESYLPGGDRMALPDEVLRFDRGTRKERALTLYALLRLSPAFEGVREDAPGAGGKGPTGKIPSLFLEPGEEDWVLHVGDRSIPGRDLMP
jgi:hypothetical protein